MYNTNRRLIEVPLPYTLKLHNHTILSVTSSLLLLAFCWFLHQLNIILKVKTKKIKIKSCPPPHSLLKLTKTLILPLSSATSLLKTYSFRSNLEKSF